MVELHRKAISSDCSLCLRRAKDALGDSGVGNVTTNGSPGIAGRALGRNANFASSLCILINWLVA